jgi:hypothetical protein
LHENHHEDYSFVIVGLIRFLHATVFHGDKIPFYDAFGDKHFETTPIIKSQADKFQLRNPKTAFSYRSRFHINKKKCSDTQAD